jgi:hypothetical protein
MKYAYNRYPLTVHSLKPHFVVWSISQELIVYWILRSGSGAASSLSSRTVLGKGAIGLLLVPGA